MEEDRISEVVIMEVLLYTKEVKEVVLEIITVMGKVKIMKR